MRLVYVVVQIYPWFEFYFLLFLGMLMYNTGFLLGAGNRVFFLPYIQVNVTGYVKKVSEKNPYPPHGRSLEIPRGRGILKSKILEAKYKAKLEFPGVRLVQYKKTFHGGSMDIFWNGTIYDLLLQILTRTLKTMSLKQWKIKFIQG